MSQGGNLMVTSQKLDRRKKYTQMVLKQSLMELLKEKQMSTITVKEICALADVNRSTFYAHYTNHFDLLAQIENEFIDDMTMYLQSYNFEGGEAALQISEKIISYFGSKFEECQTLLSDYSGSSFEKKVRQVAQTYMVTNWMEISHMDEDILEYASAFIVSGSIEMMKVWLQNDMDKTPKEMAAIITNIVNKGVGSY